MVWEPGSWDAHVPVVLAGACCPAVLSSLPEPTFQKGLWSYSQSFSFKPQISSCSIIYNIKKKRSEKETTWSAKRVAVHPHQPAQSRRRSAVGGSAWDCGRVPSPAVPPRSSPGHLGLSGAFKRADVIEKLYFKFNLNAVNLKVNLNGHAASSCPTGRHQHGRAFNDWKKMFTVT